MDQSGETELGVQGTEDNPFTHAPEDWDDNGIPYGAFCLCSRCAYVGTSTVSFDYRAAGPGDALHCDQCAGFSVYAVEQHLRGQAIAAFLEDHPESKCNENS